MGNPNLFLLAPARSGTTQLATWLASHPEIGAPPVKEPNHFSRQDFPEDYVAAHHLNDVKPATRDWSGAKPAQFAVFRCRSAYLSLFHHLSERYCMDASTTYFPSLGAIRGIHDFHPDARVILLTRDPVSRTVSHYQLAQRIGQSRRSLLFELEKELAHVDPPGARFLLRPSRYKATLDLVKSLFPEQNTLVLDHLRLINDPAFELARVARFLDIPAAGFDLTRSARNASVPARVPALNRTLHTLGVKTWLRSVLPASLKPVLKRVWFSGKGFHRPEPADLARLEQVLRVT